MNKEEKAAKFLEIFYWKGLEIPAEIFYNTTVKINERYLLAFIFNLQFDGGCEATNKELADLYGCSERKICRLLNELEDKEHIKIEMKDKSSRKIFVTIGTLWRVSYDYWDLKKA